MSTYRAPTSYEDLMKKNDAPAQPAWPRPPEEELDSLLCDVPSASGAGGASNKLMTADPFQRLRDRMINELIPVFVQLVEKYSDAGFSMQMDASNFLEGGREIRLEFGIGEYRAILMGTVTTEAIAFHETRHAPNISGEITSGPMLRLRGLTADAFRQFICQRLTVLLRTMLRAR